VSLAARLSDPLRVVVTTGVIGSPVVGLGIPDHRCLASRATRSIVQPIVPDFVAVQFVSEQAKDAQLGGPRRSIFREDVALGVDPHIIREESFT
jgi:hypothetical protein